MSGRRYARDLKMFLLVAVSATAIARGKKKNHEGFNLFKCKRVRNLSKNKYSSKYMDVFFKRIRRRKENSRTRKKKGQIKRD